MSIRARMTVAVLVACTALAFSLTLATNGRAQEQAARRGAYLVSAMACADCHTPFKFDPKLGMPVPDRERFLSGHPAGVPPPAANPPDSGMTAGLTNTSFRFPFGVIYAANLTPDETGLKGWSEKMFVDALRTGRHMGGNGRPIYPPMPWTAFRNLTDEDLKSIYAYLQTIKSIRNDVPEAEVPPPVMGAFIKANEAVARSK